MRKNDKVTDTPAGRLLRRIDILYHGRGGKSDLFRWCLLAFDCLTICYFIAVSFLHELSQFYVIDEMIGLLYLLELAARVSISKSRWRELLNPINVADTIVIISLLLPMFMENFSFLRVLRALRLLRSYHVLKSLRRQFRFIRVHGDIVFSVVNLIVFIFVVTAVVYVFQVGKNPAIHNYMDALYFTVATLTTTGFGDITLVGSSGHALSVLIMIIGISLFLRLIQTIFRAGKVHYECPDCGLTRHDNDAIHCKHCGALLHIKTEGYD